MPDFSEEKSSQKLGLLRIKEEEESTKLLAEQYGIPYIDLSIFPIELDAIKTVPEADARHAELAVFQAIGRDIKIAVRNPHKDETKNLLTQLEGDRYTTELFLASKHSLEHAWEFYKKVPANRQVTSGMVQLSSETIQSLQREIKSVAEVKERIEKTFKGRTTEALEIMLAGALALDTSDIHVEPQEQDVRLRFRVDGVLYDLTQIPTTLYHLILSRIKLISEMKLNIHDRAQDGRFTIKVGEFDIEIRVSILPGPNGENIVMRVLNPQSLKISFNDLGMQPWVIEQMKKELEKPNGMIITTGPTGSGKTTTLYAFLKKVHSPEIKIITIEDPIEYHLLGIEQTQAEPEKGYDFASGLRAIVRQDPDIILVGEIRDKETAEIAIQAALTGHLVLSTLHTNNAAGTIPRLTNLGIKASFIAPAINVSIAQRLIRKLCSQCKKPVAIDNALEEKIQKELSAMPKKVPLPAQSSWTLFSPQTGTCAVCSGTGYKGRIGVYEIIIFDEVMTKLISTEPSEFDIQRAAQEQGQITMRQDGILKILAGQTDFEELERMIGSL